MLLTPLNWPWMKRLAISPGPFKAPSGPLAAKELMTSVPLVSATPPVPMTLVPPPVKVLLPVITSTPPPLMVNAAIPGDAPPEMTPESVEKSVVVVPLSLTVTLRVARKPVPRSILFLKSVSASEVVEPRMSVPVPLPMPPTPQTTWAPLPRLTVSFDVLAAKPPEVLGAQSTWPGAGPIARENVPELSSTPPLR